MSVRPEFDPSSGMWVIDSIANLDPMDVNRLLVWGQPVGPLHPDFDFDFYRSDIPPVIRLSNSDAAMTFGRNIRVEEFDAVKKFTAAADGLPDGTYTLNDLESRGVIRLGSGGDQHITTNLYGNDDQSPQTWFSNPGQALIFGSVRFELQDATTFTVEGDTLTVDARLGVTDDNFNYESDNALAKIFNFIAEPLFAPFKNYTEVELVFEGEGGTRTLTIEQKEDFCFLPGTPIAMWGAPDKPIEAVTAGDLVVSYDRAGRLVPGRVRRVFTNEVRVILDLFGLMLTPGHVTLCGEGEHAGRHVPVLDILRTDGALVMRDGSLVRAATGCEVGSEGDAWVAAVAGQLREGGRVHVTEARHIRAGTRVITADGGDVSVLEAIRAAGGEVGPDGWVRPRGEPEAEGQPFHWAFSDRLPAPEDYVLARSGTTLSDIYAADEWEAVPPLGEVPAGVPAARPEPNLPLALRGLDDPLAARGGAFAPSDAARAVTTGALPH